LNDPLQTSVLPRRTRLWLWLLIGLLLAGLLPAGDARAQIQETPVDFDACAELDEDQLRSELNQIAQEVFAADANGIDLDAIIARQWDALGMDMIVDRQVDEAIARVARDEELLDKFLSGWSPEKAEELTRTVAETAFGAEAFRQAIDQLPTAVAAEIEAEIALLTAESVSFNLMCLREFIDRHYSAAIVEAFAADIRQTTGEADLLDSSAAENGILAVIDLHKAALGGIGVIIAAQITRRIAIRIAQRVSRRVAGRISARILGRVGTELIPLVGWVIGTGLIVYDVIDSLDGALPQIQESLRDEEVKVEIRREIAATVEPELRQELPVLAREIANDLYAEWLEFRRKYRQVLTLAEENPAFADLLARSEDLAKMAELVDETLAVQGRSALEAAIADGSLEAVMALPPSAVEVLAHTGSLQTVLAWSELAGRDFELMTAAELYKHKAPADLDRELFDNLLALDDPTLIAELSLLEPDQIRTLLQVSTAGLRDLAAGLTTVELGQLADYLVDLDQTGRNRLLTVVTDDPSAMTALAQPAVRAYLAEGNDVSVALAFLRGPADVMGFLNDILRLATRQIPTQLFAVKYGWPLTATALALPALLALLVVGLILRPFLRLAEIFGRAR
jgi:hypothetical protein